MPGVGIDGLDHVQVAAPPGCEREARRFYGELLGLRELDKPEGLQSGGVWFAAGGQELHVGVTQRPLGQPARAARSVVAPPAFAVPPAYVNGGW